MAARHRFSPEERDRFLAEWQATGVSAAEFAPRAGVTAHTLYAWRRRVRAAAQEVATSRFAEVVVRSSPASAAGGSPARIEIVVGDALVRVGAAFDDAQLRRVLDVLRTVA